MQNNHVRHRRNWFTYDRSGQRYYILENPSGFFEILSCLHFQYKTLNSKSTIQTKNKIVPILCITYSLTNDAYSLSF
jgi:hypothetical protein